MRMGKLKTATAAVFVLAGAIMGPSAAFADASAIFKELAGSWRGEGDVVLEDGTRERLSCRGYYVLKSQGDGLSIATLCSSTTQKFEIRSLVAKSGDGLSGQWEERTYHATGQVTGAVNGKTMDLAFTGPIDGTISIALEGKAHSVKVTAAGAGIKGVSISLIRG